MPLGPRIFFTFVIFLGSMFVITGVGIALNSADIHGPFIDEDYLTDWANWKYVTGLASAAITLLNFYLLGRRKSGA